MTNDTMLMAGIIILTVPTIVYGGFFLLQFLSGKFSKLELTGFQRTMFRAGHAHAGVLVLLSLILLPYVDVANLSSSWKWIIRISIPLSAILISGGFFGAAAGKGTTRPGKLIGLLYIGVISLMLGLVTLGIGLLS